ncbi:MAG: putative quinol monooxygenase [Sodalis sp. (in: enterobacteria)]|uniref:putative quinol monooxygenase n=1 Tax=Sodalis sp. (in: enterobacteria) TaxID=1898979 RepID=UPI0039E5DD09
MSTDIHVVAVVDGKPGSAEAIVDVVAPCIAATRREQGCLSYTFHQDKERPDSFMFIETWASEDALERHAQSAHLKVLVDGLAPQTSRPLEVSVLQTLF